MRRAAAFLALLSIAALSFLAVMGSKGTISEVYDKTRYTAEFSDWSAAAGRTLTLKQGNVLQVEIARAGGNIGLDIRGENGTEAYAGNRLSTGMFTVTAREAGEYVVEIKGVNATGSVAIRILPG